jgi:hypothetical protein
MWKCLKRVFCFFVVVNEIYLMKEILMSTKNTVQELANQIGALRQQISDSIANISADIQALTGQLAGAATSAEVTAILQPQIDALTALAATAQVTANIVPDTPTSPEPGEEL